MRFENSQTLKLRRRLFLQSVAIKIGAVFILTMIGRAPFFSAMSTWFAAYAIVAGGFAIMLNHRPLSPYPTLWDEAALFALSAFLCRFASERLLDLPSAVPPA
jgi:hypothetical protein